MVKILVVDDSVPLLKDLIEAASGDGREVISTTSADEAIELIGEHDFDVVIADLRVPEGEEGFDILRAAKSKDPFTQVIVITSAPTQDMGTKAMRLGAYDYVVRDIKSDVNIKKVSEEILQALDWRSQKIMERDRGTT